MPLASRIESHPPPIRRGQYRNLTQGLDPSIAAHRSHPSHEVVTLLMDVDKNKEVKAVYKTEYM